MDFNKLTTKDKIEIYLKIKDFLNFLEKKQKEVENA